MATAQPANTKRHISQEQVDSPEPSDGDSALKKQKLEPTPDEVQADSTEPREPDPREPGPGSSDDSDVSEVDLEDASDGDSDDLDAAGKPRGLADGEEFDESHSGDPVEGDDDDTDGDGDGEVTGDDSEEELPIIEGTEVELVQQAPEPPLDVASDCGCYLLRGKGGRVLKLAISENAISEIHTECLELFDLGRLPRIHASNLEVISDSATELTVHASTVNVSASYPVKKYSEAELEALGNSDQLEAHLLAREKDWCVIEVAGYDILFGSKDLMPED